MASAGSVKRKFEQKNNIVEHAKFHTDVYSISVH